MPDHWWKNRWFLFISSLTFLLFLIVVALFIIISNRSQPKKISQISPMRKIPVIERETTERQTTEPKASKVPALPLPKIEIGSYVDLSTSKPKPSPTAFSYSLKQNYSLVEIKELAEKLSAVETIKQAGETVLAYSTSNNQVAILTFNTTTGKFSYFSTEGLPLSASSSMEEKIASFLKNLNLYDQTIRVSARFRRQSEPNILYLELHRDWSLLGHPLLNPIGLLNLPENQSLANLSLTSRIENTPADPEIYQASDGKDGLARQDDFNTITVGISEGENKVVSLVSNLRPINPNSSPVPIAILSYEEALAKLRSNLDSFILTAPAGAGNPDFAKVYPQNQTKTKEAVINQSAVVFLEKPPTVAQTTLVPHYLFRGAANLDSGYRVNFIAAVPAARHSPQAFFKRERGEVAAASYPGYGGQQQGELEFETPTPIPPTPTPSPTSLPTQPPPILSPTPTPSVKKCIPAESDLNPIYEVEGVRFGIGVTTGRGQQYYYIPSKNITLAETDTLKKHIDIIAAELKKMPAVSGNANIRKFENIVKEFTASAGQCPVRATGSSPSLFVYGKPGNQLTILVEAVLTYTDPGITNKLWSVIIQSDGRLLVEGKTRNYLYYEYLPVHFNKPQSGWRVKKTNLDQLAENIASQLQLTTKEKERLLFELKLAVSNVDEENLFLGLIPQKEIDQKLPLSVKASFPVPIHRYHFYLGKADAKETVNPPILSPLKRNSTMVLEIGAAFSLDK